MKNLIVSLAVLLAASTTFAKGGSGSGGGGGGGGVTVPQSPLKLYRVTGVIPPCDSAFFNVCDTFIPGTQFNLTYTVNPNVALDPKAPETYPGAATNLTLEFVGLFTYTGAKGDILLHSNGIGGQVSYQIAVPNLGGGIPVPKFSLPGQQNKVNIWISFFDNSATMSTLLGRNLQTATPELDFQKFTKSYLYFLIISPFGGNGRNGTCSQCFGQQFPITSVGLQ